MEVKRTEKGRGVYATRNYRKGQIVERCNVIVFPRREMTEEAILAYYMFEWTGSNYAIALGNGSLFNHSYEPNMVYLPYPGRTQMWFQATRTIKDGDELTINYNGDPDDKSLVHFLDTKRAVTARGK